MTNVVLETLLFLGGTALAVRFLAERDYRESAREPFRPPSDGEILARTAFDRVTATRRGDVNTGLVERDGFGGAGHVAEVHGATELHYSPTQYDRSVTAVFNRIRHGEKRFAGANNGNRQFHATLRSHRGHGIGKDFWAVTAVNA